jgi:hypothetical protein
LGHIYQTVLYCIPEEYDLKWPQYALHTLWNLWHISKYLSLNYQNSHWQVHTMQLLWGMWRKSSSIL